jgi:hypothetical protein
MGKLIHSLAFLQRLCRFCAAFTGGSAVHEA